MSTNSIAPPLRAATVEDVIVRMREGGYPLYAPAALGSGMGPAQLGIWDAVLAAQTAGLVSTETAPHSGKTMLSLTPAGHAYCVGSKWATVQVVYGEVSARCVCGATLTKRLNAQDGSYWVHGWTHEQRCPAYECACGRRHNAAAVSS